jgi:hypothetical protein
MIGIDQRAAAHFDLEPAVCNVSDMANVSRVLMEHLREDLNGLNAREFSGPAAIALVSGLLDPLEFCVNQLHHMSHALRNEYYAPLDKMIERGGKR